MIRLQSFKMPKTNLIFCFFIYSSLLFFILAQKPANDTSSQVKCVTGDQCYVGEFCYEGVCRDKCMLMRCAPQTKCQMGKCNPICNDKTLCEEGYYCGFDGMCLDKCLFTKCGPNYHCQKGQCFKDDPPKCSNDNDCQNGFMCSGGVCVDKCIVTTCPVGSSCQKGQCKAQQPTCSKDQDCQKGNYCQYGKCHDLCSLKDYCSANQTCVKGQCIDKQNQPCPQKIQCSLPRPDQKTCPTIYFIRKPDPILCGINNDGEKIDLSIECQACKQKSIMYYFKTTCDKVPKKCLQNSLINTNQPSPKKVCNLLCKIGYECREGKCVKTEKYEKIQCCLPRPNQKTCPTLQFIREPDPLVCGVNKNGEYVDFPVQCYACKQREIIFYYNATCKQVKEWNDQLSCQNVYCKAGYICQQGKCIEDKGNTKIKCANPRPSDKTCPVLYFIREPDPLVCGVTQNNTLIDFPVECYACKTTNVLYYYNATCDQTSQKQCEKVKCKNQGQICLYGKCVPDENVICPEVKKTDCKDPRPNSQTCPFIYFFIPPANIVCGVTQNGQRISYPVECYACKNKQVKYYYSKSCQQLSKPCQKDRNKCKHNKDCSFGKICKEGTCQDKCLFTNCLQNQICHRGYCVPTLSTTNKCQTIRCKQGYTCVDGTCVQQNKDKCKDIFCIATHRCVNGQCVPINY